MKCVSCSLAAVDPESKLCKKHFVAYVEKVFLKCVKDFKLFTKKDKLCVAVSGGKDSLTLLYLLSKNKYDVTALCIDEGIKGYREHTLADLHKFCRKHSVKLKVASFEKDFKLSLDKMLKKTKEMPCSTCGTLRRYLLNKYARKFDKLVMGHNMDDEAQAVLMNYLKYNVYVNARLGPVSGLVRDKRFVPRVKPLYFLSEKQVAAFAYINGFVSVFSECPYSDESFRGAVRDFLNAYEQKHKGSKRRLIEGFIDMLPLLKKEYSGVSSLGVCEKCGEVTNRSTCNACMIIDRLK